MTTEQHNILVGQEESSKKCHRVPRIFRRNPSSNEDCYNPLVVSIGPYHHKDDLNHELAEMQSRKNEMVEQFANKSRKTREFLYRNVAELANSARKCYDEDSTKDLDDNAFTEMMLLDGCFILQFIFCYLREPDNLKLAYGLMETSLMSLRFDGNEGQELMENFMEEVRGLPRGKSGDMENNNQPAHLLDFYHNRFMGKRGQENPCRKGVGQWSSYRSVMELKSVGIHFMPSKTDTYTDLRYKSTMRGGTVTLPRIVIDDSTKSLLLNLMAHEACPGSAEGFWVTSCWEF
ncbi:PREDICTED: uncharacterized protein LOC105127679 [Populus euphratica]|uniref:Uncharacterized protein LOC105127679 n=1 Tax=Populus euphratica TaxID=75702 RepID=A0AAJ6XQK3_POPEU|nr:PREDICTED: uncharacterized protein LOC105127679 [Populus euphratica]